MWVVTKDGCSICQPPRRMQSEILALRQQLADVTAERDAWKEKTHDKYWQQVNALTIERDELRAQVVAQQAELGKYRTALLDIKSRVCGDAMPNWENTPHTGYSRGLIADECDIALDRESDTSALTAALERGDTT